MWSTIGLLGLCSCSSGTIGVSSSYPEGEAKMAAYQSAGVQTPPTQEGAGDGPAESTSEAIQERVRVNASYSVAGEHLSKAIVEMDQGRWGAAMGFLQRAERELKDKESLEEAYQIVRTVRADAHYQLALQKFNPDQEYEIEIADLHLRQALIRNPSHADALQLQQRVNAARASLRN